MFPWKTSPATQKKITLVIDGDRTFRHFAMRVVKRLDCTAIGLRDAEETLKWLDAPANGQQPPSLIIIDPELRRIDGFALCEMIRMRDLTAAAPVLFASSRTDPGDDDEAVRAGADLFLPKPVRPDLFESAIERLLRAGRHVQDVQPAWEELVL